MNTLALPTPIAMPSKSSSLPLNQAEHMHLPLHLVPPWLPQFSRPWDPMRTSSAWTTCMEVHSAIWQRWPMRTRGWRRWEDQCTRKEGSVRRVDWTGAWTTPKQHTHTHFKNLNTLSPTIRARCFEFGVFKVLRNTQMFYLVELTLLTCLRIFVYKIASGSPKAWVWIC